MSLTNRLGWYSDHFDFEFAQNQTVREQLYSRIGLVDELIAQETVDLAQFFLLFEDHFRFCHAQDKSLRRQLYNRIGLADLGEVAAPTLNRALLQARLDMAIGLMNRF